MFCHHFNIGDPGSSDGKKPTCNVGDLGLIPQLGRFLGGGHDNLLQCSCLEKHCGFCRSLTDGLQSMGSQRVGHDWTMKHSTAYELLLENWIFLNERGIWNVCHLQINLCTQTHTYIYSTSAQTTLNIVQVLYILLKECRLLLC